MKVTKTETYSQLADKYKLNITPEELGVDNLPQIDPSLLDNDLYKYILLFLPHYDSDYCLDMGNYNISSGNTNTFLKTLFSEMEINNVYVFSVFQEKSEIKSKSDKPLIKIDIKPQIITDKDTCLYLYHRTDKSLSNGGNKKGRYSLVCSVFRGIRNALAHGNIRIDGTAYVFYSKCPSGKLSFYMRISDLKFLYAYKDVLELYRKHPKEDNRTKTD